MGMLWTTRKHLFYDDKLPPSEDIFFGRAHTFPKMKKNKRTNNGSSSSSNNLSRLSLLTRALEQQPEKDAMVDSKSNLPRLGLKVRTTAALQPPTGAAAAATTTTTTPPPAGSPHDNHPFLRTMPVEDDNGGSGAEMTTTTSSSPYTLRSPPRDIPHPNWHKTRSSHNH